MTNEHACLLTVHKLLCFFKTTNYENWLYTDHELHLNHEYDIGCGAQFPNDYEHLQ